MKDEKKAALQATFTVPLREIKKKNAAHRKKRNFNNAAYKQGQGIVKKGGGAFYGRFDRAKTIARPNQDDPTKTHASPLRTTMTIDLERFQPDLTEDDREKLGRNIKEYAKHVESHIESDELIIAKRSSRGTPVKLSTPKKGHELNLDKRIGDMRMYSNRFKHPIASPMKHKLNSTHVKSFSKSASVANIKEPPKEGVKNSTAQITLATLKHATGERQKRKKKGLSLESQSKVMTRAGGKVKECGVNAYARAAGFGSSDTDDFDYNHLVSKEFLDKAAQRVENLVAGTKFVNTDIIMLENQVKKLVKRDPVNGIEISVSANLVEGTHIADEIIYEIKTKEFQVKYVLNALTEIKPHRSYERYVSHVIDALIELYTEKNAKVNAAADESQSMDVDVAHPSAGDEVKADHSGKSDSDMENESRKENESERVLPPRFTRI